jgi:hypothetical protein
MATKLDFLVPLVVLLTVVAVSRADLVSYWTLDEGGGTTAYDSGPGGNDGTLMDNPNLEDPTWIAGINGGAMEFHGVGVVSTGGDYFDCGNDASLDITGPISIALWLRPDADDPEGKGTAGGETAPMAKADSAVGWSWQVRYGWGSGRLPYMGFQFAVGGAGTWVHVDRNLERYEWCHVACSHDGATVKCYLNGQETDSTALGQIDSSAAPVLIGSDGWLCDWTGGIDDVRIYDHALTEAEILGTMSTEPLTSAYGPNPRDGEMIVPTAAILQWQAGEFATGHELYMGTDAGAVAAATPDDADLFAGRLGMTMLPVGAPGGPFPDGLVPGTTYYWRVDEVNDTHPDSPWKGTVWSFSIQPAIAFNPFPPDGMKHVGLDQDLSWSAAANTFFHTIYLGQTFEEVDSAVAGGWMSTQPVYDPGALELDTTYYWRVDEFKGATTDKGEVWSFTTRGDEGGVKAEYFAGMDLAGDPVLTQVEGAIDHSWSGEVAAGLSDQVSARWRADLEAPFTETYQLITTSDDGVRLWLDGRLIVENWTDHGPTDNSAKVDLVAGQIYRIVMEFYENGGGAVAQLSWESDTLPRQIVPQGWLQLPVKATGPSPVHNAPHADQNPTLGWTAGDGATGHQVYLGDAADAVANADASTADIYRGQQAADVTTYNPGPLEWGKTYYWRVDEVNADGVAPGAVWCFTTADFLIIDDFESYDNEVGSRPFEVWIDGYGFSQPPPGNPGNGSNAAVGHDIWSPGSRYYNGLLMETSVVNSGYQSMPVDYNNVDSPHYSQIDRTWTMAQNWTVSGVDTLTLHVRGTPNNALDRFYVTLTDSAGATATVTIENGEALTSIQWVAVNIPLADFAGVNPAAIKAMSVGVGNPPAVGGAGSLLFDDFRVTKAAE